MTLRDASPFTVLGSGQSRSSVIELRTSSIQHRVLKSCVALVVATIAAGSAWAARHYGWFDPALVITAIRQYEPFAPVLFALVYAAVTVLMLPALPFNLAAGLLWGAPFGGLLCALAGTIGGCVSFMIARAGFGRPSELPSGLAMIDWAQREVARRPWAVMAFVRLNPAFPTGPLNYVFGLTPLGGLTFALTTFVCLLPPALVVAAIGERGGDAMLSIDDWRLQGAALLAAIAATCGFGAIRCFWSRPAGSVAVLSGDRKVNR